MKVFLGLFNISSLYEEYTKGLTALGHEVYSADFMQGNDIVGSSATSLPVASLIARNLKPEEISDKAQWQFWTEYFLKIAWQKALEADVCIFLWCTFRPDCSDLAELKSMGKKVIVRFVGNESRVPALEEQFNALTGRGNMSFSDAYNLDILKKPLNYVRLAEKYADVILGASLLSLRPTYHDSFMLDHSKVPFDGQQRAKDPVLLHAPSNVATKGAGQWERIFAELKAKGLSFTVKQAKGMVHDKFLQEYAKADINCGGIYHGGKAELEALAGGAVPLAASFPWPPHGGTVSNYMRQLAAETAQALGYKPGEPEYDVILGKKREVCELKTHYYQLVHHITPETASAVLQSTILDYERRKLQALAGRRFIENYCDPAKVWKDIMQILEDPQAPASHGLLQPPYFFYKQYKPHDDPRWLLLLNAGTAMVQDCLWYKQYIKPGKRDGLVF